MPASEFRIPLIRISPNSGDEDKFSRCAGRGRQKRNHVPRFVERDTVGMQAAGGGRHDGATDEEHESRTGNRVAALDRHRLGISAFFSSRIQIDRNRSGTGATVVPTILAATRYPTPAGRLPSFPGIRGRGDSVEEAGRTIHTVEFFTAEEFKGQFFVSVSMDRIHS